MRYVIFTTTKFVTGKSIIESIFTTTKNTFFKRFKLYLQAMEKFKK